MNTFLNELRQNEGAIWVENGAINLSVLKKHQSQAISDFIVKNKSQLISLLTENKIFSEEEFKRITIFRDNSLSTYPLSYAQERLWFIEQYEEGTTMFHMREVFELAADTDVKGIKYALQQIVTRHEVLRSTIEQGEKQGYGIQVVHGQALIIKETNVKDQQECELLMKEDFNRPFDLSKEYPVRINLYTIQAAYEQEADKIILLINIHHIARDGWSMGIFQKELLAYYEAYLNKDTSFSLPALEIQYKDYAVWQRSYLTGETFSKQLSYWKNKLQGYQTLALPTDYPRPNKIDHRGSNLEFTINKETSRQLRNLAQRYGVTLQGVMLSSINILLSKYTGQEDIVTGSLIANRHHRQTEELIGFFANTQVHRTLLNSSQSFAGLIQQVHYEQTEAQLHQDLPIEALIDALGVERDSSRNNLFQVRFEVQSFGMRSKTPAQEKNYLQPFYSGKSADITDFDLSIVIDDSQEELCGQISYATSLFHPDTITRLVDNYTHLLKQLTEAPDRPYSSITLLHAEEYKKIIYKWNETDADYPKDKTIYELFQEQAEQTPDNIAVVYEGQQLSYKELNEKSNQLARHIRTEYEQKTKQELAPDTIIILCLDRSIELVIGMLAVLKAGAAYLPVDPSYPQERIDYIVADTVAELILSQRCLCDNNHTKLPQDKLIYIGLTEELYKETNASNLPKYNKAKDIAYVIYTSGTTGKPKASLIEHHSFVNLNKWYSEEFKLTAADSYIICSEICFDLTQKNYFSPLIKGAVIYIPKSGLYDPAHIAGLVISNNIKRINCAPSAFAPVLNEIYNQKDEYAFDYIFLGGEPIPDKLLQIIKSKMPQGYFVNTYGPSECCDVTTFYKIQYKDLPDNSIPLGIPVNNFQHYVLDNNRQPVPIGVIGELYIGGAGLSRAYLNSPDLTAERFIPNPFATEADKMKAYTRLYKTGDLVRWLPNGNLEYLGRNDDQVKIRGYRIELAEIEHALTQLKGIKQACVLAKERQTDAGNSKCLVAYYVLNKIDENLSTTAIQQLLSQSLPEYLIPAAFTAMEAFPLTINGKLDKRALPDPDFSASEEEYIAPVTELEKEACNIWQTLLGVERIGMTNDFFRTGGNSILAIQASHRMSKALACDVKVADVFKYKTIAEILAYSIGKTQVNISKTNAKQTVLSFAQERLWFIEQYEEGTNAYHLPNVYELDEHTDKEGIKYALQQIVSRHEVLRSMIDQNEKQEGIQRIHDEALVVEEIRLTDTDDYESLIKNEINRPFELSKEYPIRVKLYTIGSTTESAADRTFLLINIHHIASDGWSYFIFQVELFAYYEAYVKKDLAFSLPTLEIQYKDYAIWQKAYLTGERLNKQLAYWENKLAGYQALEFPTDYARPDKVDYKGAQHYFTFSAEMSGKLRALSQRYGVTLHSVLLSSITILLNKYTGQDDIVIGSPIANRHHRQTEGLIGLFVNSQVNRTLLNKTQNFEELIQQVHQDQVEGQLHQDLPFEKLVNALRVEQETSSHPIFQVLFSIENFDQQSKTTEQQNSYFKPYPAEDVYEVEKLDFSIYIDDSEQELMGKISYATSLFKKETIERLIVHLINLIDQLTTFRDKPYSQFNLLSPQEYKQVVCDWNATDKEYRKDKTIIDLFEEQVIKVPHNIAVEFEEKELSYRQLNEQANKLADYLKTNYNTGTNDLVGILLDRSEMVIVAMLGILKAGAAYVCIDPDYPRTRKEFIIADTSLNVLITQADYMFDLDFYTGNLFAIDVQLAALDAPLQEVKQKVKPDDLAYVIYTSGTTGKPKGVMVEHKGLANFIQFQVNYLEMKGNDTALQFASFVFDASLAEIFTALTIGAKLSIVSATVKKDARLLSEYIRKRQINIADIPPSLLSVMPYTEFPSLKTIIIGGQSCPAETISKWSDNRRLVNAYGPTEITICATMHKYERGDLNTKIGRPIDNARVYVVDNNFNPVPVGITGELYIGGAGLTRAYLNRPELSAERFVPNPFASETDKAKAYTRLYKTGDLVRWLPDGTLEYIGRNDGQVKIRGFRIELGEIENALLQIPGIKQSCVLAKERKSETGTTKYIVAYYVPDNTSDTLSQSSIIHSLAQVLPEYMVPGVVIAMESFALTINGKLDKRALPDPEFNTSPEGYVAPVTATETEACKIWQEVLGLEQVGITDNFFRIGGNSILAIQVSHQMSIVLNSDVKVADIFKLKNIGALLENMKTEDAEYENIEKEF